MLSIDKLKFDFLFNAYFGEEGANLKRFVSLAYLDMNRTLRGISTSDPNGTIQPKAGELIKNQVNYLNENAVPDDKTVPFDTFDSWHHKLADALIKCYTDAPNVDNPVCFTYGQAQKWINMTIKYCWLFGGSELQGLDHWFKAAHIPVDRKILYAVIEGKIFQALPCKDGWLKWGDFDTDPISEMRKLAEKVCKDGWSKWKDWDEYQSFQDKIRIVSNKCDKFPLYLESIWWNKSS